MKSHNAIHPDLIAAQELVYESCGFICKNIVQKTESQEYGACTFEMNNNIIKFRVAKITPTKIGQFVTLWKRIGTGPIMPYDMADSVDLFVVSVRNAEHFGQFVFPKSVLWQKGFVSKDEIGGKRAMRVYPPWDITDSPQAKKTQSWQLLYFVEIQPSMDIEKIRKLFS
ncbi:MAG: MepB family protein [Candidatus Dependentiae bacterium]|nr:MepB family protein [Candidatus Dependentiae bacterium]